ncbi:MAG TPA: SPOR domain-containing protein [Thermoanaerobaculia bacterium]|jgi:cell division septation protein DedD
MSEEALTNDEQSHYEISLTAGQAFIAFVLLLLSLAASFAFGLMIGRGQGDERLVVKKEPTVVTEASVIPKKNSGKIVELGVAEDDFNNPATKTDTTVTAPAETAAVATPVLTETTATEKPASPAPTAVVVAPPVTSAGPAYAQLLSTGDQKTAEALAAKLINGGFNNAYVERTANEKGPIFRVRVKFASEAEAKGSEAKLKVFSNDVWITMK